MFKNPLNPAGNPVHPKAIGGGAGGAIAGAIIYLIQTYWIKNSLPAGDVSLIYTAVGLLLAFGAAYLTPAKHYPVPPPPASTAPPVTGAGPVTP